MITMKNRNFLFLFLVMNPALCLRADDNCASNSRTLFPIEDFATIVGNYISEGRIVYSLGAQKHMNERGIAENDIKYTLRYPAEVAKTRFDGTISEYSIMGVPDKDGNQLELRVSFESQRKGPLTVDTIDTVVRSLPKDGAYLSFGLSQEDFVHVAEDYIGKGKIVYSPNAQEYMRKHFVKRRHIERTLLSPDKVTETLFDGITSKYTIAGSPNINGRQLHLKVSLEAQRKEQLTIDSITRSSLKKHIPLSRDAFVQFIKNYLSNKNLIYTTRTRQRMSEQNISENDILHALKHPKKVGDRATQKDASGKVVYIRGETANKKLLHLGISLEKKKEIAVTTVGRILNDQIPLSREDFIRFVDSYIGKKRIIYTRFARGRMDNSGLTEEDIEYVFKHPTRIERKSGGNGYHIVGQTVNGQRPLRLVIAFGEEIVLITVDIF